jgi:N-acetylneuraminic acid mutarotase
MLALPLMAAVHSENPTNLSQRALSFEEQVAHQRAIEEVYWRHRIWPTERSDPKPDLDAVMSHAQLEKKVADYLRSSQAFEDYWQRPITAEQLQAEMDRMAQHTKQPEVLQELFDALGNDPFVIAECLARLVLTKRLVTNFAGTSEEPLKRWRRRAENYTAKVTAALNISYTLPTISGTGCAEDVWTPTETTNAPSGRYYHTAIWTGSEMIVWGGEDEDHMFFNSGGRYDPITDDWSVTSTAGAPIPRVAHTAVWTGTEMIVWGGSGDNVANSGGKYNPATDSWTATTITNAPEGRDGHTALWAGDEMIIWGGRDGSGETNTGGKYDPATDSWSTTSVSNAPDRRSFHTAVWTGSEMIVWGGYFHDNNGNHYFNTGGRYDPNTDSWTPTNTTAAPSERSEQIAVWTGSEMIVWGGGDRFDYFDTGGRYNPALNSWTPTQTRFAPVGRREHTAVWTGTEVIVWGGFGDSGLRMSTGGKYNPTTDSWTATTASNVPGGRAEHATVWTGNEMIVWGGELDGFIATNTGGRYCQQIGPTPTPTPCTGTCAPTPRPRPIPRVRPTPPR